MKCARNKTTCARSVELFVDVHVVKRHAIVDVLCRPVVNVLIGVHIVVLFVPLVVVVHFVVLILLVVILYQFITLFSRSHFSHMFALYSHGILGVVFTQQRHTICIGARRDNYNSSLQRVDRFTHIKEVDTEHGLFNSVLLHCGISCSWSLVN